MELAALAVLGGAGYLLAQQTAPKAVYPTKSNASNPIARASIKAKESFANMVVSGMASQRTGGAVGNMPPSGMSSTRTGENARPVSNVKTSLRGNNPQLDIRYNDLMGRTPLPTEPDPSDQPSYLSGTGGSATGGRLSIHHPSVTASTAFAFTTPAPIATATPDVMMNPAGFEANPQYIDGEYVVSQLTGNTMKTTDFVHNNMQPFFGSRVRQNVGADANVGRLDRYTGAGSTDIRKKEVEQMFDNTQQPFGNVYGLEDSSEFIQGRINDPRNRAGERPFEPVRVAPGVGEGFSATGKGGFQQIEVNDIMMKNIRRTDDLRVADKPKLTYTTPVVPGQQFIGKSMDNPGEVRKYRPDTFYIDESGERFGPGGQDGFQKEMVRSTQILPHTTRPETSVEYKGSGSSQEFGMNYVVGSYRTPMTNQYGGAGYRNADGSGYFKQGAADDYGKSSYEIRPNERYFTGDRMMGLNVSPAEAGAVTTHFEDESRPTRRGETIGNYQAGNATGYAAGAPAITVWDPNDIARTTVKEGTINLDRFGIASPADAPARLKVYDPDDIARPTQKAQISAKSAYTGGPKAAHERHMSHSFAYNMRLNPNKQQVSRRPALGGGNIQIFKGDEPHVTSKKLDIDLINDRSPAVNRVVDMGPGAADIGRVKYRAPPKLDVSAERNQREMIAATENNPLMQSLRKNAEHDESLLHQLQQARPAMFAN